MYDENKSVVEIDENLPKFHKTTVFQYHDEDGSSLNSIPICCICETYDIVQGGISVSAKFV